jgi:outer membrane lipopolysaccharide assembly protein LptE/RlpB
MTKRIRNLLFGAVILVLGLTGCAGYRLGSMLPADIKTVYVPTFVNRTTEPMIEIDCTAAAIRQLQQDGSLKVVGQVDQADAILDVTLRKFELEPLAYSETEKTTANEYRMRLTASVVLRRTMPDQIVVDAPGVQGESTFFVTGDFTTSKQQGLPPAANDLGHSIVEQIVEAW